ncbi:TIGR04222 domain-containing membrane protein [Streptomyces zhihengii]|uniref:TIGR04222 domain-containing membrane protein n=1 Tax=Streptomyces zhihengii TaxID=1818004 RepID=A0ABS2UPF2_9ACTN|nr:TIGR04222 domain-containing membrane protein [Streptomyces zhihengii]MBM9618600.1 TIGR04222 domain-containing membrane protein [Streptomyces zhihengii]
MTELALLVWSAVVVSSVLLLVRVSAARRGAPRHLAPRLGAWEAAFLAGGPARVADAALAALHADGRIRVGAPGVVAAAATTAHDPVERAVLDAPGLAPSGALAAVRGEVMRARAVQGLGDSLAARGLLTVPPGHRRLTTWGSVQGILCLIGLPVSLVLTFVQFAGAGHRATGLPFVVVVGPVLLAGAVLGITQSRRAARRTTPAGRDALVAFRVALSTGSPTVAELVASRGTRAVPDRELSAFLAAAARQGASRSAVPYVAATAAAAVVPVWCAGVTGTGGGWGAGGDTGGSGCGGSSGSGCGSPGSSCGGSGSSCGSSGSSCGSSCGGSSCGS